MAKNYILTKPIICFFVVIGCFIFPQQTFAVDNRVLKVAKFLQTQDSPLVYFAPDYVSMADKYALDYRLLVAISGTESSFGKNYLTGTYNVYGWGGGEIIFKSWTDGIDVVSKSIKKSYVNRGADTIEKIGVIYCPPTSFHWSNSVNRFMDKIEAEDISNYSLIEPDSSKKLTLTL